MDRQGKKHRKSKDAQVGWRVSAYAFIKNKSSEVLMVEPTCNTQWQLPGGGVEINESLNQAVERECYEETGYRVRLTSAVPLYVAENNFLMESKNLYFHSLILIYPAELADEKRNGSAVNSVVEDEIARMDWIKLSELNQKNCHYIFWPMIKQLPRVRGGPRSA